MSARNRKLKDEPDDFLANCFLAAIWIIVFSFKVFVGVLSIPLVVVAWLHGLGSRTIEAVRGFVNPES